MPSLFDHSLTVDADSIDVNRHASNIAYIRWMQDAAVAHSAAVGWSGEDYLHEGVGWFVRSHQITYLAPANEGNELVVRTWVDNFRAFRSLRKYEFYRAEPSGEQPLLAMAETDWVFVNLATGKPQKIAPNVLNAFSINQ